MNLTRFARTLVPAFLLAATLSPALPLTAQAAGCTSGSLIKGTLPAVYYCGADGKRYVFTNDKGYFTWYADFSGVQSVTDETLAGIAIGGNVTYRPGVRMVKIQSDPRTYAISNGGVLRHVGSEDLASCLYGSDWKLVIDDISDAFFVNYKVGAPIASCTEYDASDERSKSTNVNQDKNLGGVVVIPAGLPNIASTSPANLATNVAVYSSVTATFSEAMRASSVNDGTFLVKQGTSPVSGTVSYSGGKATFTPTSNFQPNTTYTATITTGVRDLDEKTLTSDVTWSFTTKPFVLGPSVISNTPVSGAKNVALNTKLIVEFDRAMIRASLTTDTFKLMKGTTAISGKVVNTVTGMTFTPNTWLVPNATYTATVTTGARDSDDRNLDAPYVWTFTTGEAATGGPAVKWVSPNAGTTNVSVSANVTAHFSEAMDPATVTKDTFTLTNGGTKVDAKVTYGTDGTAVLDPTSNLQAVTVYMATVTLGAKDLDGHPLKAPFTWTFTTGS